MRELEHIREDEKDRKFCRHGMEHLLDVARLMYIEALEAGEDAPRDLIYAAALLHDIGRSQTHSIMHAVIGAHIAINRGLSPEIVEIIRRHTGAGIDPEDAKEMGLPDGDYIPRTLEQKIVAHADNLVSDNCVVKVEHSVEKLERKGAHRGAVRVAELHKELSALYGEDLDCMVDVLGEYPRLKGVRP